ncbi:MAG: hypothetical protein ACFE8J_19245, partial [Candidatus Heimdallarchaeota archaeon]
KIFREYDFYINIYDDFVETHNNEKDKFLWKMNSIIELMKVTEGNEEGEFCENGLRMIMILFKDFIFSPLELKKSAFENTLNQGKEIIIPILKRELDIY